MGLSEARALARQVADAATGNDPTTWAAGAASLAGLDGRAWLLLDESARAFTYDEGAPVSGARGWMGATLVEPSGFVATVTCLHTDGRFRQRAVRVLHAMPSEATTPALAVRLLDHVSQVREAAWEAIRPRLRLVTAEVVLDVLLAGADRQHAGAALEKTQAALLDSVPADALVASLAVSDRRRVRRWAFQVGHEGGLLTSAQLVRAARADADQWISAVCAGWLAEAADPSVLPALLDARSVEARLVALTKVAETGLDDDTLHRLLLDRAPRVRGQARSRARRRSLDVDGFYRRVLAEDDSSPRAVAASLDALATTGDEHDLEATVSRLQHPNGRVRAAAVAAVQAVAAQGDAAKVLTPALVDASGRVSSAAARALARLGVPPSTAEPAWASDLPSVRRAGWRLARAAGGWHRVEADLRAAADPDPVLADLGRAGVRNWLEVRAATTWEPLPQDQRERLTMWLRRGGLDRDEQRVLAFHAGLEPLPDKRGPSTDAAPAPPARRSGWLRLVRRT